MLDSTIDELKDEFYYYSSCVYYKNKSYIWTVSYYRYLSFHRNFLLPIPQFPQKFTLMPYMKVSFCNLRIFLKIGRSAFNKLPWWKSQVFRGLGLLASMILRMFYGSSRNSFFFNRFTHMSSNYMISWTMCWYTLTLFLAWFRCLIKVMKYPDKSQITIK